MTTLDLAETLSRSIARTMDRASALADARVLPSALPHNLEGARALAGTLAFTIGHERAIAIARAHALADALADILAVARDAARAVTIDLAVTIDRDLAHDLDLVGELCVALELGQADVRRAGQVTPSAGRLVTMAARLLHRADRLRYAEEWRSELWELAHVGAPRRRQLAYGCRLAGSAVPLRAPGDGGGNPMSQALGHWAKTVAAVLALGRLMPAAGWAALAAAVIVAGVMCWILSSPERTDRAARLIGAARGQAAALPASPPAAGYKNRRHRGRHDKG